MEIMFSRIGHVADPGGPWFGATNVQLFLFSPSPLFQKLPLASLLLRQHHAHLDLLAVIWRAGSQLLLSQYRTDRNLPPQVGQI